MISAPDALAALERLREGNRRFVAGVREGFAAERHPGDLAGGQRPFAIVLGCSDSRVAPEIVFDQALGDLFAIRVAGHIAGPSQVASVEFAATQFGTRLVVVLGHSQCGAVLATLDEMRRGPESQSSNLRPITGRIRPSLEALLGTALRQDPEALVREAVRAHVRAVANALRHGSPVIQRMVQREGLVVVGAEYSLETGLVEFFDGLPEGVEPAAPVRRDD